MDRPTPPENVTIREDGGPDYGLPWWAWVLVVSGGIAVAMIDTIGRWLSQ